MWSRANLVDGVTYSAVAHPDLFYPSAGWNSDPHDEENHTEWVRVELAGVFWVNRVDLYPRTDDGFSGAGFPVDFEIRVSLDKVNWTPVAVFTDYVAPGLETQTFAFAAIEARYVEVVGTKLRFVDGSGVFRMTFAELDVCSGPVVPAFHLVGPTYIQAGESGVFRLVRLNNSGPVLRDRAYTGDISFASTDPEADLPPLSTVGIDDRGGLEVTSTFHTPGLHTLTVSDGTVEATSPVFRVTVEPPESKIYFGDIHAHTSFSDSHIPLHAQYDYARNTALNDFASVTDHDSLPYWNPLLSWQWVKLKSYVDQETEPGRFVAILGYEWTNHALGHKNVYYFGADNEGEVFGNEANPVYDDPVAGYSDPEKLWDALVEQGVPVLTVPHHVARNHSAGSSTDWSYANPELQRLVEVYSVHGSFETCQETALPYFPLLGVYPGRCVQDALGTFGHRLGFVASSDHHLRHMGSLSAIYGPGGHSGLNWGTGLAAIVAEDLTRDSLYAGLLGRRTYATTGERIFLEFDVDRHPMGSELTVNLPHSPTIELTFGGTADVSTAEIIKYDTSTSRWTTELSHAPQTRIGDLTFVDENFTDSAIYYARIIQDRGPLHQEPEMAWSSPVWVDVAP